MIEVNSAIVTACAPALKPLFTPHLIRVAREASAARIPDDESSGNGTGSGGFIRSKRSAEGCWSGGETIALDSLHPGDTRTEVAGGGVGNLRWEGG